MLKSASGTGPVVLADEPPFRLGSLWVEPAFRQVRWAEETETLEPKVMQVLVALARAEGQIVSRDWLVERCWNRRFVGENAINRVLSRVRALGGRTAAFEIQTITKVGYRLRATESPDHLPPDERTDGKERTAARRVNRRHAVLAVAGAGAAASGVLLWRGFAVSGPPEEAVRLTQHALDGFRISQSGPDPRVLAELQEAVRIAPDYAEAWGGLAAVYVEHYHEAPVSRRPAFEARARAAAARALAIDPREPRASIALLELTTNFGRWAAFEAECRRLLPITKRHPLVLGSLATLLQEVGRWSDSTPLFEEVNRKLITNPIGHYKHVLALWGSGQIEAAELALEKAMRRFPRHPAVWQTKVKLLMFGGRPDEAIAVAEDRSSRPASVDEGSLAPLIAAARAISSGSAADAGEAIRFNLERLPANRDAFPVAYRCAVLGDRDEAFAILDGYYFGRGRWAELMPPKDGSEGERWTSPLFQPPASNLWRDARFDALTEAIGLGAYWQRTGSRPDYLRLL